MGAALLLGIAPQQNQAQVFIGLLEFDVSVLDLISTNDIFIAVGGTSWDTLMLPAFVL